ncbi:MAG: hypothetical protein QGH51_09245 [Planctomycetota bacterium]|jgi:hypothetical protein|nr:hypothetical protein [Planctomycetota bacterium]MDP6942195.1 hypothetical protein [Planctomycetota bacterium]
MRTLLAVLCLGFSGGLIQQWFARYSTPMEFTETSPQTERAPKETFWHRPVFGEAILSPSALDLKSSLRLWGNPETSEWETLSGPDTAAARATLGSWLNTPPGGKAKALSISFDRPSLSGPILAKLHLRGAPKAILPWISQILAKPPAGALTDPLRLSFDAGIEDLEAELEIRIGNVKQMEEALP